MTAPLQTLAYSRAAFTTSGGIVNARSLFVELLNAGLPALGATPDPTQVLVQYSAVLDGAQEADAAAVVAAHDGLAFAPAIQRNTLEAQASDDSGNEVVRLFLDTGPLPAGDYVLSWYLEAATTADTGDSSVQAMLYASKNGSARVERGQANYTGDQWGPPFSGTVPATVQDGDRYRFELCFRRLGLAGNAARVQRARLGWVRL